MIDDYRCADRWILDAVFRFGLIIVDLIGGPLTRIGAVGLVMWASLVDDRVCAGVRFCFLVVVVVAGPYSGSMIWGLPCR